MKTYFKTTALASLPLLLLAALPLIAPSLRPLATMAMAISFCALGLLLLLRAGQVSFGHALYFACGAYATAFGARHASADALAVIAMAVLSSAALGAVLGLILSRYRDIFYAMLNLAFSMVGFTLVLKLYDLTGGSDGMPVRIQSLAGVPLEVEVFGWALFYTALVMLALALLVVTRYLNSPPGQALAALKTNETRLEYLGISGRQVLYFGHVFSAALAGLGGAIAAMGTGHVTPEMAYWSRSAEFVFIAVLGGIGNVLGALLGAVSFEAVRSAASAYAANSWQLIMGMVLVAIVLFAPTGLFGLGLRLFGRKEARQ
ncbi:MULTISPECIES: branched-chain amino acid ABC transporter permease [Achromobacter]|uniref:Branched-chain amino acid ABC transporter permease n=1 Tax=Achromobacter denitrificans TaxID=32002 RepID=A0A3R9H5T9_ACHDE|nr:MULTISPECIES: branched-chain amino acid ABC transporter permease [Achromobacter]ASC67986.1 branched-chain amino acid ABC transporter permease [Achromobacter denitrificans]MDF3848776.1 branched-chain amino acid ABC transporter permease [Achromobacter denitrificans]MDF3942588.1 branched-chain amino acid ABC transporter permease [Achromobacter denitrificans]MDX3879312.1 branched-chain amino acid ABC transporter permease [Achromobacter sp.]MPT39895.1 branched-chain amino acid ABC transporter pe